MKNTLTLIDQKSAAEATHITHGGIFHGDEVFATVMLLKLSDVKLARVFRVPENTLAFVYDIGGGVYDHHQKGRNGERPDGVPYAAAGLIWRDLGVSIVKAMDPELPDEQAEAVVRSVDRSLVEGIDGQDNGIARFTGEEVYASMSVSNAVSRFNPNWDSEDTADEAFAKAVSFAEIVFDNAASSAASAIKAEGIVNAAVEASKDHVMVLDRFVPWQGTLLHLESERAQDALYVVFPSLRGGYNVQCVPDKPGSYSYRKPLPTEWHGNPTSTGIDGCTFVHPTGFLASCTDLGAAKQLAAKAVSL